MKFYFSEVEVLYDHFHFYFTCRLILAFQEVGTCSSLL